MWESVKKIEIASLLILPRPLPPIKIPAFCKTGVFIDSPYIFENSV